MDALLWLEVHEELCKVTVVSSHHIPAMQLPHGQPAWSAAVKERTTSKGLSSVQQALQLMVAKPWQRAWEVAYLVQGRCSQWRRHRRAQQQRVRCASQQIKSSKLE